MKKLKLITILLFSGLMVLYNGCKDDDCPCDDPTNPVCENYDLCYGITPVTADFEIGHFRPASVNKRYMPDWIPDMAFRRTVIGFRPKSYDPKDTSVKYTWILGAETIHDGEFERDFSDTRESSIPVTLIIQKKPNLECFPDDDGRDTLTKQIHFVDRSCDFLTNGDFKVLFEGEKDSVIIKFRNWFAQGRFTSDAKYPNEILDSCARLDMAFIGLNRALLQPDTVPTTLNVLQFYSSVYTLASGGNEHPIGNPILEVDPKTLKASGEYHFLQNGRKDYKFKGRKIK